MQNLRWSSFSQKIGYSWKLLMTVVLESFVLNVTGLVDSALIRLRQLRISSGIYIIKLSNKKTTSVASIVNLENISYFILLLLLLN